MANKPTAQQLFAELQARYGTKVAEAFMAAIDELRSRIELQRVISAIQAGNVQAAIDAMHLDAAAYDRLLEAIRSAYAEGGAAALQGLPGRTPDGSGFVVRFSVRNPRAEAWLQQHSAQLVTRIVEDQRLAVQQALFEGVAAGANPRTTALDIVGRQNRVTGKREGGILGLTADQAAWAKRYSEEIAGSPPDASALQRKLRDRRFDRSVAKAIREGTPLPAETQAKMVAAYRNRALKLRGDTIGKHETFTALAAARHEGYQQAIDSGRITAAQVRKTWRHFASEQPRLQHVAMAGRSVGFDEKFILPDGTSMLYPHDPSAPASHTLGCKCQADYRVDWLAGVV